MSDKKNLKSTSKLSPKKIKNIKILRANRFTYSEIANLLDVSEGSAYNYSRDVALLPKNRCRNPFEPIALEASSKALGKRLPTSENIIEAEELGDVDYFIEDYEIGTPFANECKSELHRQNLIDEIVLDDLQKLMEEPTDYHSPLTISAWMTKYLAGKKNRFLKYSPHTWTTKQLDIFELWWEHKSLMLKIHRDFGKSMIADAILVREVAENRDNNYAIGSEVKKKAAKRIKHVGDTLLTNKTIIADYGFLPHTSKFGGTRQSWTKDELTVKRDIHQPDPTLFPFSNKGADVTGVHVNGVVYDDIWSRLLQLNAEENVDKFVTWYDGEFEGCLEDAWELWIYTRKGVYDVYRHFEDKQQCYIYKLPAIIQFPSKYEYHYKEINGQSIFDYVEVQSDDYEISDPERFEVEHFLRKKLRMRKPEWEAEYMLNPTARTGEYWKKSDLRYFNSYNDYFEMVGTGRHRIIGAMDLAYGVTDRADYTALAIIGIFNGKYYLLEVFIKRGASETQMAEMIKDARKQFGDLRTVYVEADFWQSEFCRRIKRKVPHLSIQPVLARQEQAQLKKDDSADKVKLKGKQLRIWTVLEPVFSSHRFFINKSMRNRKEFIDEFDTFPRCKHFDVLDAISMGVFKTEKTSALIFGF
jgi:phage terminase large subunit-like protein